jgi:pyruvate dehydrogenase E2 component (dihydrolipoamide acetyltransferase)
LLDFLMPALGADMDEGTVLEWLVKPGDQIRKGDIIAVIDTSKSAIEVESFHTGIVQRLVVAPGETVPVGTVLAVIGEPAAETVPQTVEMAPPAVGTAAPAAETLPQPAEPHPADASSPLIRHLARDLGVDLTQVTGTGRAGTVTRADVERAAARPLVPAPSGGRQRRTPHRGEPCHGRPASGSHPARAGSPGNSESRLPASPAAGPAALSGKPMCGRPRRCRRRPCSSRPRLRNRKGRQR